MRCGSGRPVYDVGYLITKTKDCYCDRHGENRDKRDTANYTVGGGGRRDAQALLDLMDDPAFDPVREREEFLAAREKVGKITR